MRVNIAYVIHLFEPMLTMAVAGGPINMIPSQAKRSEKVAFSLRKPYLMIVYEALHITYSCHLTMLTLGERPFKLFSK